MTFPALNVNMTPQTRLHDHYPAGMQLYTRNFALHIIADLDIL